MNQKYLSFLMFLMNLSYHFLQMNQKYLMNLNYLMFLNYLNYH